MTMKLGTQTASVVNHLLSGTVGQPVPEVGMGATILMWTDRHAATIVDVSKSGRRIGITRDIATRTDSNGMSESQSYTFATDANAPVVNYTLRKNGSYVREGESIRGQRLRIGDRNEYRDYSF